MVIVDGDLLNATVGNLSKYTEYSVRGAAVNSKGQSNFTISITIRTSEDGEFNRPIFRNIQNSRGFEAN